MFDYDKSAESLLCYYELEKPELLTKENAIPFQNISANFYQRAQELVYNIEEYNKMMRTASYSAAIARHILTRD